MSRFHPQKRFITGRNEVLAKVIFLHLFVILFTGGGVPDQVHPPGTRYTPRDQVHPLGPGTPPGTRYTPPGPGTPPTRYTPQDQVHPPGPGTPPRPGTPPGLQTPEYGQRSAGTHPTGMHSCVVEMLSLCPHFFLREIFQELFGFVHVSNFFGYLNY